MGFKHISVEEGLSQNTVKAILKGRVGYMWFGTRDGLNKYGGYKITIYKHDSRQEGSISDNFIKAVFEDDKGTFGSPQKEVMTAWMFRETPLLIIATTLQILKALQAIW